MSEQDETPPEASGLLDRVKKAKEQAESLASKASELTGAAAATASKVKDVGAAKLGETLDDFNAALPVLREAGYSLSNVDIGIGIPPKIIATFLAADDVTAENVERVMAEHADKKLTLLLMKSLYQAWQLQTKVQIVGLKPKGLAVELGIVPTVTVKFA